MRRGSKGRSGRFMRIMGIVRIMGIMGIVRIERIERIERHMKIMRLKRVVRIVRRVRIVHVVLAAGLLLGLLSGCSASPELSATEPKRKIALILRSDQADFWRVARRGAEEAAKEFGVELTISGPPDEENVDEQVKALKRSADEGAEAYVLAANDDRALSEAVDDIVPEDRPVIAIDTELHSSKVRAYIGIDNYEAGRKAGAKLAETIGGKGKVAVMGFKQGQQNAEQRELGLLDELAKHPDITIVTKQYCYTNQELCAELTRKAIVIHNGLKGIVAMNAISSVGVAETIQDMKLAGQVKMVTFDSTPEDIALMQEGVIEATIILNPFNIGYLGVKNAVEALDGKKLERRFNTETKVIDQENMFWSDNQKLLFPFVR
ncbi:substrate-binding domain-containing protein [Paenibacillus sp. GCM10023252]|uniref:substrate-binding domain-containing protein n=1 Tax=Paenibacillus sp. GCM10023252 TaxID=3252649 RepID=UPI00360CA176